MTPDVVWHAGSVARADRSSAGTTVWFTGLSGSGKSTVAAEVERSLVTAGRPAYLLDGDNLRLGLNADLGFSAADRTEVGCAVAPTAAATASVAKHAAMMSTFR